MLEIIGVKNFKSLKDITYYSKNLNLLVGLNGMGKSSLIQVLLLLKQSFFLEGQLVLKGMLTDIGKGKDALYQFAEDEFVSIAFKLKNYNLQKIQFCCKQESNYLGVSTTEDIIKKESSLMELSNNLKNFQYISADRIIPTSLHETSINSIEEGNIGIRGEFAIHFLYSNGNRMKVDKKLKHEKTAELNLLSQVNGWLGEISPGANLVISEIPNLDKLLLDFQFEKGYGRTSSYKPQNVGYGLSFAIPIIVTLLTAKSGKIIIIENPEAHIHPRGQAELGKLIALAASTGAQLFIETHSDHIINGIRVAVKENLINKNDINISYFDKFTNKDEQYTTITNLKIDSNGELNEYPKGFLDEWNNQLLRLI